MLSLVGFVLCKNIIISWAKQNDMHLAIVTVGSQKEVVVISKSMLTPYSHQDVWADQGGKFVLESARDGFFVCGGKHRKAITVCDKTANAPGVLFRRKEYNGKFYFKTDNEKCLTVGEKNSIYGGLDVALHQCKKKDSQLFTFTNAPEIWSNTTPVNQINGDVSSDSSDMYRRSSTGNIMQYDKQWPGVIYDNKQPPCVAYQYQLPTPAQSMPSVAYTVPQPYSQANVPCASPFQRRY